MSMSFIDSESLDKIMNEADDFIFVSEYNHPFNCKSLIFLTRGQGLRLYLTRSLQLLHDVIKHLRDCFSLSRLHA